MKFYDMHCHSAHSEDSETPLHLMCQRAVDKGLKGIAFTEHVDFNPADQGYGYFNKDKYLSAAEEMEDLYGDKILILKGMEFDEPHLYPEEFTDMKKGDWDVVIGSVHMIGDLFVGDPAVLNRYSLDQLFEEYYIIMRDMVEAGGFDVLAHLDFPKRYFGKASIPEEIIDDIIQLLAKKEIALEINTSPLRKGHAECSPHIDIVNRYAMAGGKMITLGSDAHVPEDIAADFDWVKTAVDSIPGLTIGHFEKRAFIPSGK